MSTVEALPDGRYRIWDGADCTRQLEIDELERQLQGMSRGIRFYTMKPAAQWHADDLRDLDRMENVR